MRRRSGDVFELGEEQLLDEPAVELSDAEDPLAIPPDGGGPADEERGSAPASAEAHAARPGRRPLILDAIGRAGGIRTAAALALFFGVVAMVAAALSAESDEASVPKRPEGRATLRSEIAAPRPVSDAGRRRPERRIGARTAQRGKVDRAPEAEPKRVQAAPSDAGRVSPDPGPVSVQAPNPAPVPSPAPAPSEAASAKPTPEPLSRGEILYREFGP